MRHLAAAAVGLLTLAATLPSTLPAQETRPTASAGVPRWYLGGAIDIGQPIGDLQQQVRNAVGLQAHLLLRLDARGNTALRLQAGWLNYGNESEQTCLAATPGCRVQADVSTSNNIFALGVGPEFSIPLGTTRLYGHGLVGLSRYSTLSTLGGGILPDLVAADENFGDTGFFFSAGSGIQIALGKQSTLDLGVAYQGHGRREYLTKGDITDNPDGSLTLDVKRSSADLFAIRVGFSRALSWGMPSTTP